MAGILEQIGATWWSAVGVAAIKSTILLALAGLVVWTMRRHSPTVRFRVWLGGFVSAAALPILTAVSPNLPLLPTWLGAESWLSSPTAFSAEHQLSAPGTVSLLLLSLAITAWFVGFVWHSGRALLAAAVLRQIALHSRQLPESHPLTKRCRALQRSQQVRRKVDLFVAAGEARPLTWGVLRARILLPENATEWSDERAAAVLIHELEHVRRRDACCQMLEQVVCAVYWFHPLVWWASARMRFEREAACDDAVLTAGVRPTDYAESLLELSHPRSNAWRAPVLAAPMAETRALTRRIREILSGSRVRGRLTWLHAAGSVTGFAASVLLLAALAPAPAPEPVQEAIAETTNTSPASQQRQASTPSPNRELPGNSLVAEHSPSQRDAFRMRVRPPLSTTLQRPIDWEAPAELLSERDAVEAIIGDAPVDAIETIETWPAKPADATLSLDDLPTQGGEPKQPMRPSPTDTHGRVSQATPNWSGSLPLPL